MNSGIYSLVARDLLTNKTVEIKLTGREENRYKANLAYIDYLTTFFNTEQELIEKLYRNSYIDFQYGRLFIEYTYANKKHQLPVLYKSSIDFTKLLDKNSSTIDLNNEYFIRGVDNFILELNNKNFRTYVINNRNVNKYLKDKIMEFYDTKYVGDVNFNKQKLLEAFSNYKTFRDFTFIIAEYKELKNTKEDQLNDHIPLEELDYHDSDDEFLTEDDYNMDYYPYNKQM